MKWTDYKDLINESAEELYENAPCGYVSFVKDGTIVKINSTMLAWLGYEKEEVLYIHKFQQFLSIGGKIFYETHFAPLLRMQGLLKEINLDFVRKDRTTFPVLLNVNQVLNAEGEPVVCRATVFDITDRKKYEKELLAAKKLAENAAKAKAEFLATISHEIRTPLNAIIGIADLIQHTPLDEKQKEYARILQFSSGNLLGLVNDILDFSKIEAGKVKLEEKPFAVRDMVKALVHAMAFKAEEKQIALETELDENMPDYLIADSLKLTQVLTNLLGNAIKFTSEGFVKLCIGVLHKDSKQVALQFSVQDTGIGIPQDKLETIFEEFSQASYDINLKYGGTGLGLTISQKLLQMYGSHLEVRSELGKGTEFSFTLTLKISREKPKESSVAVADPENHTFDGASVLVVDDNDINLSIIAEYLKTWNIAFSTASSGSRALELLQQQSFDLILLDLQMPEMDGYQVSEAIRKSDLPEQPSIIALSASARGDISEKLRQSGFNDYVSKPFKPADLYKTLYYYIRNPEKEEKQNFVMLPSQGVTKDAEQPVEKTAAPIDLSHYVKIANNRPAFLEALLQKTVRAFEEYKEQFAAAIENHDTDQLGKLAHKSKMAMFYIQASTLENTVADVRALLKEEAQDTGLLQEKKDLLAKEFEQIISALKAVRADDLLNS